VNARLAARLTSWRVDIKSLPEAAAESLRRLTSEPAYADVAEREAAAMQQVEAILLKKAENRPVTPEEYQVLTNFVDRVEREVRLRQGAERQARAEKLAEVRAGIPVGAYDTAVADVGLSDRLLTILTGAGYETAGEVLEKMGMEPDAILALEGIGPKSMEEIGDVLRAFAYPEPVVEVPVEEPIEEAAEAVAEAEIAVEPEAAVPVGPVPAEAEALPVAVEAAAPAEGEPVSTEAVAEPISFEVPIAVEVEDEEEEAEATVVAGKKAKKGKKGARVVEFDEQLGEMVVKRRRKPGRAGELGSFEEFEE
jgi:N utilization substance protein A